MTRKTFEQEDDIKLKLCAFVFVIKQIVLSVAYKSIFYWVKMGCKHCIIAVFYVNWYIYNKLGNPALPKLLIVTPAVVYPRLALTTQLRISKPC